jgi:membrane protein DedA with SNARE-associated domain
LCNITYLILLVNYFSGLAKYLLLLPSGAMLHGLVITWFNLVEHWGYVGVFVLMAMESSIIPVPSEVVMPPAAFWAAQGRMSILGVVLAGTAGSYAGSLISYLVSRGVGFPIINKYGKYILMPPGKIELAENWVRRYGIVGIFAARLLPVVRHLISIPAGVLKMPLTGFSLATVIGAAFWCTVLSWFGQEVIGGHPELLSSPEAMVRVIKEKLHWFVIAVLLLTVLYAVVVWFKNQKRATQKP